MSFVDTIQSANRTGERDAFAAQLADFAGRMRSVPRKPLKCELYGTISVVVDEVGALAILRAAFPGRRIDRYIAYRALLVLQDRVDEISSWSI